MINYSYWQNKKVRVCGIMTGTSLDGIDVAVCDFWIENGKKKFELVCFETFPLSNQIKFKILEICSEKILVSDISNMNYLLAKLYYNSISSLILQYSINLDTIDCIGVHGQTVWHSPIKTNFEGVDTSSTLQLFNGSALSKLISKPVVYDFRSADIALGGGGAPLVPIFDFEFFASNSENLVMLNIGGIANITNIPLGRDKNKLIAWDTGPGNILIDFSTNYFYNTNYDLGGKYSLNGNINLNLLTELKDLPFIYLKPPKSTGRELFSKEYFNHLIDKFPIPANDFIATLSYFTSFSIAENIKLFANNHSTIIASGGGVYNKAIMNGLKLELPNAIIKSSDEIGINPDAKEAICFAFLAYQFLCGFSSNIISVTGASKETILGVLAI